MTKEWIGRAEITIAEGVEVVADVTPTPVIDPEKVADRETIQAINNSGTIDLDGINTKLDILLKYSGLL